MNREVILLCFAFTISISIAQAQSNVPLSNFSAVHEELKEISIGDQCPNVEIKNILNFSKRSVKISEFKGKLLIIDFWATWCNPCIAALPKLNSIQEKYAGKVQILPVTAEDSSTVERFFEKMKKTVGFLPASATNDIALKSIFPHIYLPHYVWIDTKGKVVAITDSKEVSEENILKVLSGKEIKLATKIDKKTVADETAKGKPLITPSILVKEQEGVVPELINDSNLIIHSSLTRYIEELPFGSSSKPTLISVRNTSILNLYRIALWRHGIDMLNRYKTIVDIPDSALCKLITYRDLKGNALSSSDYTDWVKENGYCYELKVPQSITNMRFNIMLNELNIFFGAKYGIEGVLESKMTKYLSLTRINKDDKLKSSGEKTKVERNKFWIKMTNVSMSAFVGELMLPLQMYPPVIDETGYGGKVDLELNCQLSDLLALNKELAKYGLQLIEKEKQIEIAVVRKKKAD